ncbi:hypothetical protein V5799_000580 [Amblyomma americanum]|uniref:Uncharacterized protein n=1 Tax=Amblyomma americanum TaxID=6943 RepID=A0AAQ4D2M8_AMBAM
MVSLCVGCNAFIAYFTHTAQIGPSRVSSGGDVSKMMQALDLIHQRPYPHVGSYVVGALTAFAFLRFRNARIGKMAQLALWSFSVAACLYGVFGAFKWQKGAAPTGADVVFYNGMHRTLFAMGVAWVLYAYYIHPGGAPTAEMQRIVGSREYTSVSLQLKILRNFGQ